MRRLATMFATGWMSVLLATAGCMDYPVERSAHTGPVDTGAKMKMSMMVSTHPLWPYQEDWPIYKALEQATGIDITVIKPEGLYETAVNLAIASGERIDLIMVPNLTTANTYGDQGSLVNLFEHMETLPNYKAFLNAHPEVKQSILSTSGNNYFFPLYGLEQQTRRSWIYRQDIFDKHGLQPPMTYDELYAVAKTLKQLYPESYPIGAFGNARILYNVVANFNSWGAQYYDFEQKRWRFPPIEDNYRVMLEYLHRFYEEGLMAPDYMSIERTQFADQFAQGKAFISPDYIGSIDELTSLIKQDLPEFAMAFMPPPAGGANGKQENASRAYLPSGFSVASNAPHLDAALKYIDFLYSKEGIELVSWGKEGEISVVKDGVRKIKDEYASFDDLRRKTGIATNGSYTVLDMRAFYDLYSPQLKHGFDQIGKYETPPQPEVVFTDEEAEVIQSIGERVYQYRDQNAAQFILGQRSLAEWDPYVEEMKRLGVQRILDVYEAAHERSLQRMR